MRTMWGETQLTALFKSINNIGDKHKTPHKMPRGGEEERIKWKMQH